MHALPTCKKKAALECYIKFRGEVAFFDAREDVAPRVRAEQAPPT
jgi:hypothetical protein